ncbi:hypothetical protein HY628_02460 [Candidatus Uhrbacteria bacterium]|nr:hypothetical protein [Candidatus Uhrbacteria bacterium]
MVGTTEGTNGVKKSYFHLVFGQEGEVEAAMRLAWCLESDGLALLREKGIRFPHLFVVSYRQDGEGDGARLVDEQRWLLPLEDGFTVLYFQSHGQHLICATIVWAANQSSQRQSWAELHRSFLRKADNGKWYIPFSNGREFDLVYLPSFHLPTYESAEVTVAKEFFAPEPPAWQRWWVNLFFETKPRDECEFRKRQWFWAYPFQWLPVFFWVTTNIFVRAVCCGVMFLFGYRYVNWKCLLHPFSMDFGDLDATESLLKAPPYTSHYFHTSRADGTRRPRWQWPLRLPLVWANLAGIAALAFFYPKEMMRVALLTGNVTLRLVIILVICVTAVTAKRLVWRRLTRNEEVGTKRSERTARLFKERKKFEQRKMEVFFTRSLEPLTCANGGPRTAALAALPPSHRKRIKLRFLDLKARLCRPFAR